MKTIILFLSLALTACGSAPVSSILKLVPVGSEVCPRGNDVFTNQCHN
ncbi:hypothetical protein EDC52_101800 [Biostraticola tofi]|uniref:Lipoprotein n=1 Tax=Biostraticola tofi TaxID=466109 RepID=A0A4R3Z8N8_9GAMM|nr:hypothetical protein EDC52_101800 [Biostraticola tofi]